MITVDKLCKNFGSLSVLKNIDAEIKNGEKCYSRSIRLWQKHLPALFEFAGPAISWYIIVDGENITAEECDINMVRQKMGMVFQHFNLFPHLTVIENITLAPIQLKRMNKEDAIKRAYELLVV